MHSLNICCSSLFVFTWSTISSAYASPGIGLSLSSRLYPLLDSSNSNIKGSRNIGLQISYDDRDKSVYTNNTSKYEKIYIDEKDTNN